MAFELTRAVRAGLFTAAVFIASAHTAFAAVPLETYGQLPSMEQVTISPDGRVLAYVSVLEDQRTIFVQNLEDKKVLGALKVTEEKIRDLTWAGPGHLIITTSATEPTSIPDAYRDEYYVAQIYDVATRAFRPLLKRAEPLIRVPMIRFVDGKPTIFVETRLAGVHYTLISIDAASGERKTIQGNSRSTLQWLIDGKGAVIGRTTFETYRKKWAVELREDGGWDEVFDLPVDIDMPRVVGFSANGESVIVEHNEEEAIARKAVALSNGQALASLDQDYDADALLRDPTTQRIIGKSLRTMSTQYSFYDLDDQRKWQRVTAAFPDENVRLVSWSNDRRHVVVNVVGPKTGAVYALVDLAKNTAVILGREYQGLQAGDIAPVRAISYAAGDGFEVPAYLTLPRGADPKALPLVVLVHGGPASRDTPGFDWWSQALASRGYAVLQPQFRGSEGLGNKLLTAGYGEWGRKMQSDVSDGVRHLAQRGIVDPAKVCIVGASYGGYAALAGMTFEPDVYRCGVSVAGLSDMSKVVKDATPRGGPSSRARTLKYIRRYLGVETNYDDVIDQISPADNASNVKGPILLMHGRDDTVVEPEHSKIMLKALQKAGKDVQFIELENEDHWLSRSATRQKMLEETVKFVEAHNPPT